MGAQDTTDAFFELLNADSRDEALKLMEERVEMRIHVGEGVQMLKGLERVGGWFLRADKGLRMIPGEIKDTGHQVECDILVVRPGAKSHKLDATIKVEAGKITSINLSPAKGSRQRSITALGSARSPRSGERLGSVVAPQSLGCPGFQPEGSRQGSPQRSPCTPD